MNALRNPGFDIPRSHPPTATRFTISPTTNYGSADSTAKDWTTFFEESGTLTTDLVKSTRPGCEHQFMIHVCTTSPSFGGLVQTPIEPGLPPAVNITASAWVYVLRGQVGLGAGHDGETGRLVHSTKHGEWEHLVCHITPTIQKPITEMIIYADEGPDGACFYVDDARVATTP
jgi:hypothetical protein